MALEVGHSFLCARLFFFNVRLLNGTFPNLIISRRLLTIFFPPSLDTNEFFFYIVSVFLMNIFYSFSIPNKVFSFFLVVRRAILILIFFSIFFPFRSVGEILYMSNYL